MEYEERYLHLDAPVDIDKHVICKYKVGTEGLIRINLGMAPSKDYPCPFVNGTRMIDKTSYIPLSTFSKGTCVYNDKICMGNRTDRISGLFQPVCYDIRIPLICLTACRMDEELRF